MTIGDDNKKRIDPTKTLDFLLDLYLNQYKMDDKQFSDKYFLNKSEMYRKINSIKEEHDINEKKEKEETAAVAVAKPVSEAARIGPDMTEDELDGCKAL